jgi:hypothetical protein
MAESRRVFSDDWFQERFGNLIPHVPPDFDTSNCVDDEFLNRLIATAKKPSLFDSQTTHVLDCPNCMRKAMLLRQKIAGEGVAG